MFTTENLLERQTRINASEVPDLLALYLPEKYGMLATYQDYFGEEIEFNSKYTLVNTKLLTSKQIETWQMVTTTKHTKRGQQNEANIIQDFCDKNGFGLVSTGQNFIKDGFAATPDAIIDDLGTLLTLEVKNPEQATQDIGDVKFLRYVIQVQVQLFCTGYKNGYIHISPVEGAILTKKLALDPNIIQDIKTAADLFWQDVAKQKQDPIYLEPNSNINRDLKMQVVMDPQIKIQKIEEAISYLDFKDFAKKYEEAQEFLKIHLSEETKHGEYIYSIKTDPDLIWTVDSVLLEREKANRYAVGAVRRKGSRSIIKRHISEINYENKN